jgi:hypothetical protein
MSEPDPATWAKLGPLYVTQAAAEQAAASGQAVRVYPDGMEALSEYISLPGQMGGKPLRANASMMAKRLTDIGTYPMSGVVDMDSNPGLTPDVWRGYGTQVGIVDQMRMEDPVVAAIVYATTAPIIRSHWKIEPGGDDRQALEEAEFIRANLFEYLSGGFYTFVEQAVSAVWRGFSLFEIVARFDRDSKQTRLDQLSPMLPNTVYSWNRYESGRWGVTQAPDQGDADVGSPDAYSAGGASLPPEKLLHIAWNASGDDPEGMSILRPCYAGWKSRRLMLKLEATGFERGAFGIPYVEVDPTARTGDSATVNEILRELRTGARAWAAFPPGYTLQFADFPFKGADLREARIAAGQDMARAAMAPFLFTGEQSGSYSLIAGQLDFFTMNLQTAADMIGAALSHGSDSLIQRLCGWNYNRTEGFPKLVPGSLSLGDPKALVESIKTAAEGGALLPDRGVEESVRAALGLPELESREEMAHRLRNEQPGEIRTEESKAADTALNGSQVASALAIVQSAAVGEITRESAVGMIGNFFNLPRSVAEEILGGEPSPETAPAEEVETEVEQIERTEVKSREPVVTEVTDDQADDTEREAKEMEALAESLRRPLAVSGRELREEERYVRLDETLAPMVGVKEAMAQAAEDWRELIAERYADRMAEAGDLIKMRGADVPDVGKLGEAFRVELRRAYRAGKASVSEEMDRISASPDLLPALEVGDFEVTRDDIVVDLPGETETLSEQTAFSWTGQQRGGLTGLRYLTSLGDGEPLLLAPVGRKVVAEDPVAEGESVADEIDPEDAVENVARTSALAAADRVKAASITAVQSGSIGGVMATAAIAATVAGAVRELSPGADLVQAQRDTNTIFGLGRMQEARAQGAEEGIRSAMLESSTCDVCLSKDGSRFEMAELDEYATPDPDCFGGDQCNCIVIFIPKE